MVISQKMKALNLRTIFLGLLLAQGSFYFIAFVHTLLDMFTQIRLSKLLIAYVLWGYPPIIVSGIYIGYSRARQKILVGACVGALFYFILSSMRILIPAPYFDHSFKPLYFILGLVRNGFVCSIVAWLTHTVLKRKEREIR
jgi:hypothetical protein